MRKSILYSLLIFLAFGFWHCAESPKPPALKVYVLDGGTINILDATFFAESDAYAGKKIVSANPIFIVEHPKGRLIWDLGLPDAMADAPDGIYSPDNMFHFVVEKKLPDQLEVLKFTPDSLDFIAFSHNHYDHTGNANYFNKATWLVQESEYNFSVSEAANEQTGYAPGSYSELLKGNIIKLQGEYDVFGDGLVKIIPSPGHTVGHQCLYLELANYGPVLLSGDLYHTLENRTEKRVPRFNYDPEQTRASMEEIESFLSLNNAKLIIQHSMKDYEKLPKAPDYLD